MSFGSICGQSPELPPGSTTVEIRVLDTGTRLHLRPGLFWEPILKGFAGPRAPLYCFLVSHGNRHVLFDLGMRTDWENYSPKIVSLIKRSTEVFSCSKDIAALLDEDKSGRGIRSTDIEAIIWSHTHFDHAGDPSRFPSHTELVVGPGVADRSWPGYPSVPDADLLDSDIEDRKVRQINFSASLKVAGFDAFDFFEDGSFYLLDAPGHAPGHLCALARTTVDPPSFVFMGADACHHPGILRPNNEVVLPASVSGLHEHPEQSGCAGHLLERIRVWHDDPTLPFFKLARGPLFPDYAAACETVEKIQNLDATGDVFVLLAHDSSLGDVLPKYPGLLNDWKARNLKLSSRWLFCKELEGVS